MAGESLRPEESQIRLAEILRDLFEMFDLEGVAARVATPERDLAARADRLTRWARGEGAPDGDQIVDIIQVIRSVGHGLLDGADALEGWLRDWGGDA